MELYRKYRPKCFDDVYGQDEVVRVLKKLIKRNQVPSALLFTGPSGCGKTTLARITAEAIGCLGKDLNEINCADFRGLDTIRDIDRRQHLSPMRGSGSTKRIWIFDEAQQLPSASQSMMLKMFEEAPAHVHFMMASTDPHKILPTIKTRTTIFHCKLVDDPTMERQLVGVCKKAKIKISEDVREKIINQADGSVRKSLVLLEQVALLDTEDEMLESLEKAEAKVQSFALSRALMDPRTVWMDVAKILSELTEEPEQMRRMVLGYATKVLLGGGRGCSQAFRIMRSFYKPFYDSPRDQLVGSCYEVVASGKGK